MNTLKILLRKPLNILYIGIFFIVMEVIFRLSSIGAIVSGLVKLGDSDILKSLISVLQFVTSKTVIPYVALSILAVSIFGGIFFGVLLSGYLFKVNNGLFGKVTIKKEFVKGIIKHFKKMWFLTARVILISCLFILFLAIAMVPLIVILRAVRLSDQGVVVISTFIGFLTAALLFLGSMYYRIYIIFWYAAAINNRKNAFSEGKKTADKKFWKLVFAMVLFDLVYAAVYITFTYFDDSIYLLFSRWAFNTMFFSYYITHFFAEYKR